VMIFMGRIFMKKIRTQFMNEIEMLKHLCEKNAETE